MLNPQTRKISQLDPDSSPTPDLAGALLEMSLRLGQGIYGSRKITYEQFVATLPIGGYAALTLAQAQLLVVAHPAAVVAGTLYGITGNWNATGTDTTVYVHGVTPTAYHQLGLVLDAQGAGQLVQVQVMAGTYSALATATNTPSATPFGPLVATGAANQAFALPAGTQSVRGVQVFVANPGSGQPPTKDLTSAMYTLDTSASPPMLTVKTAYTLSVDDTMEGIAFTTGASSTPSPGTGTGGIVVIGTGGTNQIIIKSTTGG